MYISYFKKRYKIVSVFIIAILILFSLSFFLSNIVLNMVVKDLVAESSIPSDVKLNVRQFVFSFKDGIVLKDLSISKGSKSLIIPKIAIKKDNNLISFKIKGVLLDLDLLKSLVVIPATTSSSKSMPLKIMLEDVGFLFKGKVINLDYGFLLFDKDGINWDLGLGYQGLNLKLKGYISLEKELCLFSFDSNSAKTAFVGEYDFKREVLKGKVFFKEKIYSLGAKILRDNSLFSLVDVFLGPISVPGPVELDFSEGLNFNWIIKAPSLDAFGFFDFKNEEDKFQFYIKVLKAKFGEYELITNSYVDYILDEKALVFKSVGTVLNKNPFPETSFKIALIDKGVALESFNYEGGISFNGHWDYNLNHNIQGEFNDFNLHEMMTVIMPLYARYLSVSSVDGEFNYFYYDNSRLIDIILELGEGRIIDVAFESGKVHLMGNSNMLGFVNSELVIDGMPLAFEGNIDIAKFPAAAMWKDVLLVPISTSYLFGNTSFEDRFGDKRMSLGTKLKDNVRLDYNVEFSADENYNKNEVSLEIIGVPNLKLRLKDDEEIMGVEKNIKF